MCKCLSCEMILIGSSVDQYQRVLSHAFQMHDINCYQYKQTILVHFFFVAIPSGFCLSVNFNICYQRHSLRFGAFVLCFV